MQNFIELISLTISVKSEDKYRLLFHAISDYPNNFRIT